MTQQQKKKKPDIQIVYEHLKQSSLTHNEALINYSIGRLSEWIRRLRRKGHEIDCIMHEENGREYGRYHLVKEKV